MILQPKDCLRQFGDPRKGENEYMIVWNVPENYTAFITNLPKKLYINAMIKFPLQTAFDALIREGIGNELKTWDGCFNIRVMTGYDRVNIATANAEDVHWSLHSWGLGIDVNAKENKCGDIPKLSEEFVRCFERNGWDWGGKFTRFDGMHFQPKRELVIY